MSKIAASILLLYVPALIWSQAKATETSSSQNSPHLLVQATARSTPKAKAATGSWSLNYFRTLQSFGAVGDGSTDDTAAVQTALNSGFPIECTGQFVINSLITITNIDLYVQGSGDQSGCTFILNSSSAMFYATLTGNDLYNDNSLTMKDVRFSVNAVITAVSGPAQTAALFVTYPAGTAGMTEPGVTLENIQVKPTSASNYIRNGVYLFDASNSSIKNITCEGRRTSLDPASSCVVLDGTHSPSTMTVQDGFADFYGNGIYAPAEASAGWQGIRVNNFDCVFCGHLVQLLGGNDGLSDYAELRGVEGAFDDGGIKVTNALHVFMDNNYVFTSNITGGTVAPYPTCYEYDWTLPISANGASGNITNNTCDETVIAGYTTRYGVVVTGNSGTNMNTFVGANTLSNLDYGVVLPANTAGVTVQSQVQKNVTNNYSIAATAGANLLLPPVGITDGSAAAPGMVGEHISQVTTAGDAVLLTNGIANNVAGVNLTPGDWECSGSVATLPAATTTQSDLIASISPISGSPTPTPPIGYARAPYAVAAGYPQEISVAPVEENITVPTTYFMVVYSVFATSTNSAYGYIDCVRRR